MARKMVCEWGMSETLGPLTYGKKEEQIFLGKEFNRHQDYSEATALKIDAEIKRIVTEQYERAQHTLTDNRAILVRVAEALLEHEVLDAEQLKAARRRAGHRGPRPQPPATPPPPPREGKVEHEGERAGGILPPPMPAPKPTSLERVAEARGPRRRRPSLTPAASGGGGAIDARGRRRRIPAHPARSRASSSASGPGSWVCST